MNASSMVKSICEYYKLTVPQLSTRLGYNRPQGLYDIVNGKVKRISSELARRLSSEFSELNKDWLFSGEGDMLVPLTINATNSTVVGSNIQGSGNHIQHNDFTEMIKLQQGYQDLLKKKDEQIDRLIGIIENNK